MPSVPRVCSRPICRRLVRLGLLFRRLIGTLLALPAYLLQSGSTMLITHVQRVSLSLLFIATSAFAQAGPAFEVASIKKVEDLSVATVTNGQMKIGVTIDSAMVHMTSMSLFDMLRFAYKVKTFQVSGPSGCTPSGSTSAPKCPPEPPASRCPMLQALLTDRFKIALHRSTTNSRSMP